MFFLFILSKNKAHIETRRIPRDPDIKISMKINVKITKNSVFCFLDNELSVLTFPYNIKEKGNRNVESIEKILDPDSRACL